MAYTNLTTTLITCIMTLRLMFKFRIVFEDHNSPNEKDVANLVILGIKI